MDNVHQQRYARELYQQTFNIAPIYTRGNVEGIKPLRNMVHNYTTDYYGNSQKKKLIEYLIAHDIPSEANMSLTELRQLPRHELQTVVHAVREKKKKLGGAQASLLSGLSSKK